MLRRLFHFCAHKQHPDRRIEYRDGSVNIRLPINPDNFTSTVRGFIAQCLKGPTGEPLEVWDNDFVLDSVTFIADYEVEDTPEATP